MMQNNVKQPLSVFISYSRKDIDYLDEMMPHFEELETLGHIELKGDMRLHAGDKWEQVLNRQIQEANVIIFLVSPDSLASEYIQQEMAIAANRPIVDNIRVIPVLLRDCNWRNTALSQFYIIPNGARPLQFYPKEKRLEVYAELAIELSRVFEGYGEIWQSVVKKEQEEKTGTLKLANYNLTSLPSIVVEMHWLQTLDLTDNNIKDISIISLLSNLQTLLLSSNKIEMVTQLESLSNLEVLDVSNNPISSFAPLQNTLLKKLFLHNTNLQHIPDVSALVHLQELDLSGNNITAITGLENLKSLRFLNLSHNFLSGLQGIQELDNLVDLRATSNKIKKIECLENLTQLQCLDLYKNEITEIENLENNTALTLLGLSANYIEYLRKIGHLQQLETLFIAHNNIEDITELQGMPNLKRVVLTNNRISDIFPLKEFIENNLSVKATYSMNPNEQGIFIKDNPVQYPPLEVIMQGRDAILRQFALLEESLLEKLDAYQSNDIKLILIGNANVGKTHLAHFIKSNRMSVPNNNASTHGMANDFFTYHSPALSTPVNIRILDFGGQEYYHDTHHLFFTTDTIYLLLWEKESNRFGTKTEKRFSIKTGKEEDETNAVFPVAYWLDAVNYFLQQKERERKNMPANSTDAILFEADPCVVLVETKRNKKGEFLLSTTPVEEYRNLLHSQIGVSIFKDSTGKLVSTGAISLFDSIDDLIAPMYEKRWSGYYKLVVDFFENIGKPKNQALIKQLGITALIVNLQNCIELFNKIIVLKKYKYKFDNENALDLCRFLSNRGYILYFDSKKICLYPEKLTGEIYKTLHADYNGVGFISKNELANADEQVIKIMLDFKLLVPQPGNDGYIAPQLLPENNSMQLSMFMDAFKPAVMRFSITGYIHKNIIQELFYTFKENLLKEDTQNYIWKNGFVINLDHELYRINISSNHEARIIDIQYLNKFNPTVLHTIGNLISQSLGNRAHIKEVSTDGVFFVPISLIKNNIQLSQCICNGKLIRIADYKNFLDAEENRYAMKKIFISYSSKNTAFMKRFVTHLEPLKRNGDIDYWHDRMIEPGTKWDDAIKNEMELSDIIIFLLSPDFIATNYIFDVEIPKALEQYANMRSKLFFVELQPCSWDETILKDYQQTTDTAGDNKSLITIKEPLNDEQWKKVMSELKKKFLINNNFYTKLFG